MVTLISGILDSLKDLFNIDKEFVSVEIDENFVKIAETRISKGKREIIRLVKSSLSEQLDIANRKVRLNVPRHLVTVRFLRLPSTDEEEVRKIAKIESLKHIPYTDEDVISGYRIIERFDDGYSNVLLAIVHSSTIKRMTDILKEANVVDVKFISLGSEALFLWYLLAREDKEDKEKKNVLLVNIDSEHIDIDIIEGDKLVFTRDVLFDSNKEIIHQVKLSISTYRKESDKTIDEIVITGASNKVKEYGDYIQKELDVPVGIIDQMNNMPVGKDAHIESDDASFAKLLGISLKPEDVRINLTPEDVQEKDRVEKLKKNFTLSLILTGLIVVITFGIVIKKLHDKSVYLSSINSETKKIEPRVTRAKKMLRDINLIREEMHKKPLAIDVIAEIYRLTPQDISLNMVEYERHKALTLRGNASPLSEVFKYVTVLEGSAYFESAKVKYATKRIIANKETADFEIGCIISKIK